MLKKTYSLLAAMLLFSVCASAQSGEFSSYSPYSIFGVGNLSQNMSAYTASMGGTGIASRNHRYLNTANPAAVAVRDSLALMIDFNLFNTNTIYRQNTGGDKLRSANNFTNLGGIAMSFPIYRQLAAAVGITPYSSVGYDFTSTETDGNVIALNGPVSYAAQGMGSLYDIYGALAVNIGKRVSAGVQADYVFGKIERTYIQNFRNTGYNEVKDIYTQTLNSFTGKFGLQYEQLLGNDVSITAGATYRLAGRLGGFNDYSRYSSGSVQNITINSYADTLRSTSPAIYLGGELGVGVALNYQNKLRAEFNYLRADWTGSGMDSAKGFKVSDATQSFATGVKESFKLGLEYVPNINDVRYYSRRMAYRAGAFWNNEYYTVAGKPVNTAGITLGVTLPVFQWYNGLTIMMEAGQRGPSDASLVRERYIKFGFGVNLFDIWFRKVQYN